MYVRNIKFETIFDGQEIKATLKPLSLVDLLEVNDLQEKGDTDDQAIGLAQLFMPKMEGYITSLTGLKDEDGVDVPVKEMCEAAYFIRLVVQMITKLVNASTPPQQPAVLSAS